MSIDSMMEISVTPYEVQFLRFVMYWKLRKLQLHHSAFV